MQRNEHYIRMSKFSDFVQCHDVNAYVSCMEQEFNYHELRTHNKQMWKYANNKIQTPMYGFKNQIQYSLFREELNNINEYDKKNIIKILCGVNNGT